MGEDKQPWLGFGLRLSFEVSYGRGAATHYTTSGWRWLARRAAVMAKK